MRVLSVVALLIAVALAGCTGGGGDAGTDNSEIGGLDEDTQKQLEDLDLETSDDRAIIRGVVVDQKIAKLANAKVTVVVPDGEPLEAITEDDGIFGFDQLLPGTYFVKASKPGYFSAQVQVDVEAGNHDDPAIRIVLQENAEEKPYFETLSFKGFIECSVGTPALRLAACDVPNLVTYDVMCTFDEVPEEACIIGNATNDRFIERHPVTADGKIQFIQSEMTWQSTQPAGETFAASPGYWNPETGGWDDLQDYEQGSPIVMRMNQSDAGKIDGEGGYQMRVFTGDVEGTNTGVCVVVCPWGAGATVQQKFETITFVFHNFEPRPEWTFGTDGEPELPN